MQAAAQVWKMRFVDRGARAGEIQTVIMRLCETPFHKPNGTRSLADQIHALEGIEEDQVGVRFVALSERDGNFSADELPDSPVARMSAITA